MLQRTFNDLQNIDNIVGRIYQRIPTLQESKFGYAYKRFSEKNIIPAFKEYNNLITDIRVEHALEDEKTKEVLTDKTSNRGFKYSKEGLKKVIAAERELMDSFGEKAFDVEPYIAAYVPEDLTEEEREVLAGILISTGEAA